MSNPKAEYTLYPKRRPCLVWFASILFAVIIGGFSRNHHIGSMLCGGLVGVVMSMVDDAMRHPIRIGRCDH